MKNKIAEVQNYFLNKITACEFELIDIDFLSSKWVRLNVKIDGFDFSLELSQYQNFIVHLILILKLKFRMID